MSLSGTREFPGTTGYNLDCRTRGKEQGEAGGCSLPLDPKPLTSKAILGQEYVFSLYFLPTPIHHLLPQPFPTFSLASPLLSPHLSTSLTTAFIRGSWDRAVAEGWELEPGPRAAVISE